MPHEAAVDEREVPLYRKPLNGAGTCVCYVIVGLSVPFFTLYELRVLKPILWEEAAQFLMSH